LAPRRVQKVTDVVKEGDKVKVKLLGFDERGKVRLSMKVVDQATGEDLEAKQKAEAEQQRSDQQREAAGAEEFLFARKIGEAACGPPFHFGRDQAVSIRGGRAREPPRRELRLLRRVLGDGAFVRRGFVLERGGMRHGDDVVAGIDEVDLAG